MLRLILAGLLAGLVVVPVANAATPTQILRDCEDDGVLQGRYANDDLRKARRQIPTDLDQYTDCRDVLARALSEGVSGTGGGGAGPAGTTSPGRGAPLLKPDTPADRKTLEEAVQEGPQPVAVDSTQVVPGAVGFAANAARNDVPVPLIVLLALLLLAAAAAVAPGARHRVGPFLRERVLRRG